MPEGLSMNKKHYFYLLSVILILIISASGWFATVYLGNKARQEIDGESRASVLTLSVYVTSTINAIENAVKTLAFSPGIPPALLSRKAQDIELANRTLDRYSTAFSTISYLMAADGMTVASSNRKDLDSLVGKSFGFRPYFQEAAKGQPGHYFALGMVTGKRGFYASCPVQNHLGKVIGVATMKKDIDDLEPFFSQYPFCFLISPVGIIFLSSIPEMKTKSLWPIDPTTQEKLVTSRQFGDKVPEAVLNKAIIDGMDVVLGEKDYFVSRKTIDPDGWSIVLLSPTNRIRLYRLIGILVTISVNVIIVVFSGVIYFTDRSREAYRQNEESKRLLLHSVGNGIFGLDSMGQVTFVNPAALRMIGFAEEEILSQNIHRLIHHTHKDGSYYPIEDCPMSASCTHGKAFHIEQEMFWRKDSSSFPVEYTSVPITWDGKVTGAVVSFIDITDRKQAEKRIRESEEKFRLTFDASPDAVSINRLEDGLYVDINEGFTRTIGFAREEVIGRTSLEIDIWCDPDDRLKMVLSLQEKGYCENLEFQFRKKDGSLITALVSGRVISLKGSPHIVSITRDISDRKRMEVELIESRKQLSDVIDFLPDATLAIDKERRIIIWNREIEKMTGIPASEMIGKGNYAYTVPFYGEARPQLMDLIFQDSRDVQARYQAFTREGDSIIAEVFCHALYGNKGAWVFVKASPLHDQYGNIIGAIESIRDITEHKLAEEAKAKFEAQMQQSQKFEAIATLAGGVAHDFNNLLMGIQGRASLLSLDLGTSHPEWEHIHAIEEYISRAADLTRQLLGLARGGKYEVKPTDINELVLNSSTMFGRTKKEIRIHTRCHPSPLVVEADRGQIEQVFLNLYINAWQAMPPEGGELFLETNVVTLDESFNQSYQTKPGQYVKVSITDTGTGMDEATRLRIFDPFFTTKEKERGTGLGLASAYGIIKNHGGMITVYSEIGQGTTFNIYLPESDSEAQQVVPVTEELIRGSSTILLVDDEEMILEVGQALLERLGYCVLVSREGQGAVQTITDMGSEIDLVILDLVMPGMSSGTTLDRIRQIQPGMPVLLSSGYAVNGQANEIMRRGCSGFIQKPYTVAELSHKVRLVLDEKNKQYRHSEK